jgi:hypothetical protein
MADQPLPSEMETLLRDLKRGGLAFSRLEAIEKIRKLDGSHPRLVEALLRASEKDGSEAVREAAAGVLQVPVHARVLEENPGLIEFAKVDEVEVLKPSVWGWASFGLALLSILIIYLDVFFLSSSPNAVGGAQTMDISPLFCISFLLSLVGLVFGIIGLRQFGRVRIFSRLGLLLNGLIILGSLILSMAVRFIIA